ncbi:MAG: tautomerase family protein [Succinivibrio sp.]|nr:tautomerase family protein [Succinivibrio sp.]
MPFVQVKVTGKLQSAQKAQLAARLTDAIGQAFSKPAAYIMLSIEDQQELYMAGKPLEQGAFISVRLLGQAVRSACETATAECSRVLEEELNLKGRGVYISFHPVENWGQGSSLF